MGGCCVRRLIRIIYLHGSRRTESNPRWRNVSGGASQEDTWRDCDRIGQLYRMLIGITRQNNVLQPIRISPTSVFGVLLSWSWFSCVVLLPVLLWNCAVMCCVLRFSSSLRVFPPSSVFFSWSFSRFTLFEHHPPLSVSSVFSWVSTPCCLQCLRVGCFWFLFLVFSLICPFVWVLVFGVFTQRLFKGTVCNDLSNLLTQINVLVHQ